MNLRESVYVCVCVYVGERSVRLSLSAKYSRGLTSNSSLEDALCDFIQYRQRTVAPYARQVPSCRNVFWRDYMHSACVS
jgi:hypothetical protein